jgi:outer membrane immunogenic protein
MKLVSCVAILGAFLLLGCMPAVAAEPSAQPSWTGFYGGVEFGGGWSSHPVTWAPNDPLANELFTGTFGLFQPLVSSSNFTRNGPAGGFEFGYNWQADPKWVFGVEADFSGAAIGTRTAGPTSILGFNPAPVIQNTTAQQNTDWYGTVRGRLGWLATPNLLVFGTGGFAYGHTDHSASYDVSAPIAATLFGFSFSCSGGPCFMGSSSTTKTGWTAGGGIEWMLDQHWTAKIEYQLVDLGTDAFRVVANPVPGTNPPSSMTVNFRDQFSVVRLGLNFRM